MSYKYTTPVNQKPQFLVNNLQRCEWHSCHSRIQISRCAGRSSWVMYQLATYDWCPRILSNNPQLSHSCVYNRQWRESLDAAHPLVEQILALGWVLQVGWLWWFHQNGTPILPEMDVSEGGGYSTWEVHACCIFTNSASIATTVPGVGNSSGRRGSCFISASSLCLLHFEENKGWIEEKQTGQLKYLGKGLKGRDWQELG